MPSRQRFERCQFFQADIPFFGYINQPIMVFPLIAVWRLYTRQKESSII